MGAILTRVLSSLAIKAALIGAVAVGAGIVYLKKVVWAEHKYKKEVVKEAQTYKECVRKTPILEVKKCNKFKK